MNYEKQLVRCAQEVLVKAVKSWLDENRDEIIAGLATALPQSDVEQEPTKVEQTDPTYFTPGQLAERWGFHVESVRRLLRLGKLPRVWIGRRLLIPAEAVKEYERDGLRPANSP